MARFRLRTAHYLNVPNIEWETKETDKATGREAKKRFMVPLFLDPRDAADHNYRELGEIIVAQEGGKREPRDIVFVGPPTPDMEPLDEEAQAIFAEAEKKWHTKPEMDTDYSQSLLAKFGQQVENAIAAANPLERINLSEGMVSRDEFAQLQAQMAKLIEQNTALVQALTGKGERRL